VLGTLNVITAAKEFGIKRFVFSSTSAVYEEQKHPSTYHEDYPLVPNSSYGVSKASAEMYVRKNIPNHAILRYGNVFGPRQVPLGENQLIARAIRHFVEGTEFQINGDGEQSRDFVYVQDVAQANALAVTYENISGTFNISMGEAISMNAILGLLEQVYEVPGYPWEHNDHTELRKHIKLSVTEAYKKLGWRASPSLLDGLRITAQWWKGYVNA
jgi:UDP-glucose 4-epimerase